MKNIKKLLGLFVFICIFMFSATNVSALNVVNGLVEVSTADDLLDYAIKVKDNQNIEVSEIKIMNDITLNGFATFIVTDGLTVDLNGHTLDLQNGMIWIMYGTDTYEENFYNSGTFTIKDSSDGNGKLDGIGTIWLFNGGKDNTSIGINQNSQNYKLVVDGGKYIQTSILTANNLVYDSIFALVESNNKAWHDNVEFNFEINDGIFETYNNDELSTSAVFGGIIETGTPNENPNLNIDLKFNNLTFKSKNGQLVKGYNYALAYTINDIMPNTSTVYIGNETLNKEMKINDRTTSVVDAIPSSVYSNTMENYEYIKIDGIKYNLTTSVNGTGGTISESISNILPNTKKTITFTPNTGFMIDKVLVNNVETTITNNKLELTMNEDKNVVVTYKKIPFTITVKDNVNATITPNGVVNVNYGDNQDFVISASRGYKIVKVLVDGQSKELVDGTLTISNITKNLEVEVIVEKIVYNFLEGANQTYTISKDKELRFRIDADYSVFNNSVYVDGKLVDRNNYTSESGSTIIVLNQSYLDTLKVGEHTFKVEFSDGAEVETKFVVAQLEKQEENPKTFDNIGTSLLIGSISLIGLIGATIYLKKRSNVKVS